MEFLKVVAVAVAFALLFPIMLLVMAVGIFLAFAAWLCGARLDVKLNGVPYKYRWLKRVQ